MTVIETSQTFIDAKNIPEIAADEAFALMETSLTRFVALVETLHQDEWRNPTACTAWTIRDMVAHQAGGYASGTGYLEMFRQYSTMPKRGQLPEDAVNNFQLQERAQKSPAELIAELKQTGPVAIQKWAYQFRLAKLITIPHPITGKLSLRYLMWIIHSRDTWMHRLDICRAANQHFEQTVDHDGRIAALVMQDVAKKLSPQLQDRAVVFDLSGVAGGAWKVGEGNVVATVKMDVLDFNILVSGRRTYDQTRPLMTIIGDNRLVEALLVSLLILY